MKYRIFRNRYLVFFDMLLCVLAYFIVTALIYRFGDWLQYFGDVIGPALMTAGVYAACLYFSRMYKVHWGYAGSKDYMDIIAACLIAGFFSVLGSMFLLKGGFPKLYVAAAVLATGMICGFRIGIRFLTRIPTLRTHSGKNTLVIGAGRLAAVLLQDIDGNARLSYNVVGMIDDDPAKHQMRLYGKQVLGTREDIPQICKEYDVEQIIFAICDLPAKEKTAILDICGETGKKILILPGVEESLKGTGQASRIREINIEDLLERDPIVLDNRLIAGDICGKIVLVTGGGGSIGSELCRQIMRFSPARLVIVDIYENTTYELQNELTEQYPESEIDVLIASVRDKKRLSDIFKKYKPEIVFHAAAHKHVPLMEDSPGEAIKNNVFGTYNVAQCASETGARRFVMISTDKAVNPTNVMGASKRVCEFIVQAMQKVSKTEFVAVRFGNVLGSNGSVVPRFKKQIDAGGPVTVTHPEITRFFMTIPEAAQLVLQAASYAKGGEIFVLDMGKPVKIYDLARKMIMVSGYRPDVDIPIVFSGLRPGEKLYEELLMQEDGLEKTAHSKIFVGKPLGISYEELTEKLEILRDMPAEDPEEIKSVIASIVPTYRYVPRKKKNREREEDA